MRSHSTINPYVRVILFVVGYFAVAIALSVAVAIGAGLLIGLGVIPEPDIQMTSPTMSIDEILEMIAPWLLPIAIGTGLFSILYTWLFLRVFDKRPLTDLGISWRPGAGADFARGCALAFVILTIIFVFSWTTGGIRVEGFARPAPDGTPVAAYLLGAVVAFLAVGLYEELMFRGYVLQAIEDRGSKVAAIIISSLVFALLHSANPGADPMGILNTALIGALLAAVYLRTRTLWMPIGFHFAWNFLLGYVYSLPVSGLPIHGMLEITELESESRLTGGSYGPEAGLLTTVAIGVWAAWLIWRHTKRRAPRDEREAR
ncbi:MAG: CPBP family intramembrane metalloprotease [Candidatus Eisenbacteria bacterium]|nr:CPBP family intramembrane metalloprotease [Candidatus Eisenbacteria bacterium]